jgi:hypothetical protein
MASGQVSGLGVSGFEGFGSLPSRVINTLCISLALDIKKPLKPTNPPRNQVRGSSLAFHPAGHSRRERPLGSDSQNDLTSTLTD